MIKRIALAGIYHESNTFLPNKTTWKDFENGHLFYGEAIRKEYQDAHHEIGGILEVFDQSHVEIVPLFFAAATPAGMITADTYERLVAEVSNALQVDGPWDGAMLCVHGAAVAENHPDMDGDWLAMTRTILGPGIPIVCTMDPHGNVSEKMIEVTNAIVAYSTNPHLDQRDTGKKAARLMLDHLGEKVRLHQSFARARGSISIEQQATSEYPCTLLYDKARMHMENPDVLSVSIVLGFPYADVPEMASSFIARRSIRRAPSAGAALMSLPKCRSLGARRVDPRAHAHPVGHVRHARRYDEVAGRESVEHLAPAATAQPDLHRLAMRASVDGA